MDLLEPENVVLEASDLPDDQACAGYQLQIFQCLAEEFFVKCLLREVLREALHILSDFVSNSCGNLKQRSVDRKSLHHIAIRCLKAYSCFGVG